MEDPWVWKPAEVSWVRSGLLQESRHLGPKFAHDGLESFERHEAGLRLQQKLIHIGKEGLPLTLLGITPAAFHETGDHSHDLVAQEGLHHGTARMHILYVRKQGQTESLGFGVQPREVPSGASLEPQEP
jgi:hypothetical protein